MKSKVRFKIRENTLNVIEYYFDGSGMCHPTSNNGVIGSRLGLSSKCTHMFVNTEAKELILMVERNLPAMKFLYQNRLYQQSSVRESATLIVDNRLHRAAQSGTYDMEVKNVFLSDYQDKLKLEIQISKLSVFEVSAYIENEITEGYVSKQWKL
jgi:hypothetical protein